MGEADREMVRSGCGVRGGPGARAGVRAGLGLRASRMGGGASLSLAPSSNHSSEPNPDPNPNPRPGPHQVQYCLENPARTVGLLGQDCDVFVLTLTLTPTPTLTLIKTLTLTPTLTLTLTLTLSRTPTSSSSPRPPTSCSRRSACTHRRTLALTRALRTLALTRALTLALVQEKRERQAGIDQARLRAHGGMAQMDALAVISPITPLYLPYILGIESGSNPNPRPHRYASP